MMRDQPWREVVQQAEHYLAIGQTEIFIDTASFSDLPWEFVTTLRPGGTHRLDMDTSVWVAADHPSGLTLRWSFDIERRSADGKGYYEIDTETVRLVMWALQPTARPQFREYLLDCANKVAAKAHEWREITARQDTDAAILFDLARATDALAALDADA
jgi:hypothetical protein